MSEQGTEIQKFTPKKGQVDFTNARWAPVINVVVSYQGKILIVERSPKLNYYPGFWNGISGFLDDDKSLEDKVKEELHEELGIAEGNIRSIELCDIFDIEAPEYNKTWVVHAVLLVVNTDNVVLDREAQNFAWIFADEAKKYKLFPGFEKVLEAVRVGLPE